MTMSHGILVIIGVLSVVAALAAQHVSCMTCIMRARVLVHGCVRVRVRLCEACGVLAREGCK